MISIDIFCHRQKNADLLLHFFRYWTALTGDDALTAKVICEEERPFKPGADSSGASYIRADDVLKSGEPPDFLLFELGQQQDFSLFTKVRRAFPDAALLLLTNPSLSPETYITPFFRPLALLTLPLDTRKVSEVIHRLYVWFYAHRDSGPQNLLIRCREEKRYFRHSRIVYMEAREKKIYLHYGREEYSFYGTLKQMETLLPAYFARCHRSFIINAMHIKKMDLEHHCCFLTDDIPIPVSKKYKNELDILLETTMQPTGGKQSVSAER